MTGSDNSLLSIPLSEKLASVTHHHLLTRVPVKLDLDNWNFRSWEFFFEQLCATYDVEKYIHTPATESSTTSLAPLTPERAQKDTFPDLKAVRSLLITEEIRLKSKVLASPMDSSSPMVCVTGSSNNSRPSSTAQGKSWKPCFNFAKGNCRFGDSCPYVHDANDRVPNATSGFIIRDRMDCATPQWNWLNKVASTNNVPIAYYANPSPTGPSAPPGFPMPAQVSVNYTAGPAQSVPAQSTSNPGQATLLPHAFSTETLQDPSSGAWNMDTGANSHLNNSITSLSIVLNSFMYSTVSVLLRCDSTEDLYPVTAHSLIPHAFLVSQHTWHQRLGHPGSDVLCHLVSNNVISCNKEKPPVLCHACQLGKHVRLSFVSSNTIVSSCFDIVHKSKCWTLTHTEPYQDHPTEHAPNIIPDPLVNPNPDSVHHMVTRFRVGSNRPVKRLTLHVSSVSPLPWSYREAFNDVNWQNAMRDEYNALIKNSTWTLLPRPSERRLLASPPGFWDSVHPDYVCLLQRSFYALKQAPRAWFHRFAFILPGWDFITVDVTPSSSDLLHRIISSLHQEFAMTDLGSLNYFCAHHCNEILHLVGSMQYLTFTRPDISYDVQQVCLHMDDPHRAHFSSLKRILPTSVVLWIMICSYSPPLLQTWLLIQMQIGLAVLLLDVQVQVTVFFLATIYYPGPLSINRRSLVLVQKQST
ncbi:ribonuclease H-like domain-containing protein [Tanacetum coccineum]